MARIFFIAGVLMAGILASAENIKRGDYNKRSVTNEHLKPKYDKIQSPSKN
jgi:hypothetical protein